MKLQNTLEKLRKTCGKVCVGLRPEGTGVKSFLLLEHTLTILKLILNTGENPNQVSMKKP